MTAVHKHRTRGILDFFTHKNRAISKSLKRFTKWCSYRVHPNKTSNQECIMIEEQQQQLAEEEISKFNLELYRLNQKFEELDNSMRK